MSQMEINRVIAQMRTLSAGLELPEPKAAAGAASFNDALKIAINEVNTQQNVAKTMIGEFEAGTGSASVAEVMVSMQKASLSFTAMTQVRNRLVEAYQEIMNMPI
jgi:flagellar hook-basal body complex protein FliE